MSTGVQCHQKCLFGCTCLFQSRLMELGARGHAVLVAEENVQGGPESIPSHLLADTWRGMMHSPPLEPIL